MDNHKSNNHIEITLKQALPIPLSVKLKCQAGELLALVGPSGSGKTTILRAIAGLYQPENSHIICQGDKWHDTSQQFFVPAYQRHVGLVFQNYALFPHMTVLENVEQALNDLPYSQRLHQASELLDKVHLKGL